MQMHKEGYRNLRIGNNIFILFIEDYYSKRQIANQQPHISPHQQRPENLQQHQQIHKQIILNHQHASLFKTIHIHLKKDTQDCPNR